MSIRSYFEPKGCLQDPEGSLLTCIPAWQVITLVEKAIMDKGLGKIRSQYFIFMVALDAASSFLLFHAAQSLELLGKFRC